MAYDIHLPWAIEAVLCFALGVVLALLIKWFVQVSSIETYERELSWERAYAETLPEGSYGQEGAKLHIAWLVLQLELLRSLTPIARVVTVVIVRVTSWACWLRRLGGKR
ncbi:MAG: hypothetical protein WC565_07945 [Parcubacteria group bacterium]|jgi:hypothetical protein